MSTSRRCYDLQQLKQYQQHECILHRTKTEENRYTYCQVLQLTEQLLRDFQRLQVPQQVGIAVSIEAHTLGSCVVLLGILNYNCHFCAVDITLAATALDACGAHYWLCGVDLLKKLPSHLKPFACLKAYQERYALIRLPNPKVKRLGDVCYTVGTTGSTGAPKWVQVPYECIKPNISALSTRLYVTSRDVIFLCAPLTFDPFVVEFFLALQNGACLLLTSASTRLAPTNLLGVLFPSSPAQRGVTILQTTPSLFRFFGVDAIKNRVLQAESSLRVLLLGGEEFPRVQELSSWRPQENQANDKRIFNIYGITELSCWSTIHECDISREQSFQKIPLGKPLDDETTLRILSSTGALLRGAGEGELQLGSATRKCFIAELDGEASNNMGMLFRCTGDWVRRDEKGDIYYVGRKDNIIKRYGKRICLEQLEHELIKILTPQQVKASCIWLPRTQKLYYCLTPDEANHKIDMVRWQRILNAEIPLHERPDRVVLLDYLPLNAHGKVDRRQLHVKVSKLDNQLDYKEPAERLLHFLEEVLAFETNKNDQAAKRCKYETYELSFTAAGGSSFQALSLATEIGQTMAKATDQSLLLEMLLNPHKPLGEVITFLCNCRLVKEQTDNSFVDVSRSGKSFKFQWRADLGKCVDAAPTAVSNKFIIVGSHSHRLLTLNSESGAEISALLLPDRIECKVALLPADNLALVGCYDGNLYAFDYAQGVLQWKVPVGGMIKAKPLVCSAGVVVGSYAEDYNLICVCSKTREILWRKKLGSKGIYASPIKVDATTALICTLDGSYALVNILTGLCYWQHKCETPIFGSPVVLFKGTYLAIAEVAGKVHLCSADDGVIVSTYTVDGNIFSSLSARPGTTKDSQLLLFGCYDKHVYCLQCRPSSDSKVALLWRTSLNDNIFASPLACTLAMESYIVACSTKGYLALLCLASGELCAAYDIGSEVFSTPCFVSPDRFYIGCRDNFVYCFSILH